MKKQVPDLMDISEMIELTENGRLAIPEFQRPFVWKPPQVSDLLVSVARRWPIGTLLLLEGPQDFAVRSLAEAPELTNATLLVLDGQQRTTALYRALGDHVGDEVYYVDFEALAEDGELSDDHIKVRRRDTFFRRYPDVEARARAGIALIREVADPDHFLKWLQQHAEGEQTRLSAIRNSQLGGLQDYSVPAVRLPKDIGFEVLAKIFETINRTGERLATFDLMVARLYPHEFDLRAEWKAALDENRALERFEVKGMEILRLIALRAILCEIREGATPRQVKGIRQGDVLGIGPDIVKRDWGNAVEAYVKVLSFVESKCGVVTSDFLPAPTMLLPLATILASGKRKAGAVAEHFFWAAGISQAYAQGANTQAVKDARDFDGYLSGGPTPDTLQRAEVDEELLMDSRRRNEVLLRTLSCLLIRDGARDWLSGELLSDLSGEDLVESPVFPEAWLRQRGIVADALLNWTVQKIETADEIDGMEPADVLGRRDTKATAVKSQLVSPDPLKKNDWGSFAELRRKALRRHLEEVVQSVRDQ